MQVMAEGLASPQIEAGSLPTSKNSAMLQAVALCQGVTNPESSGIGGGGFIMVRTPNGTYEVIDAREQAPAAATQDMYMCATACLFIHAVRPVHPCSKTADVLP